MLHRVLDAYLVEGISPTAKLVAMAALDRGESGFVPMPTVVGVVGADSQAITDALPDLRERGALIEEANDGPVLGLAYDMTRFPS